MKIIFTDQGKSLHAAWGGDWRDDLPQVSFREVSEIYGALREKLKEFGGIAIKSWERNDIEFNPDPPSKRMVELNISKDCPGIIRFLHEFLSSYSEKNGSPFICIVDFRGELIATIYPSSEIVVFYPCNDIELIDAFELFGKSW